MLLPFWCACYALGIIVASWVAFARLPCWGLAAAFLVAGGAVAIWRSWRIGAGAGWCALGVLLAWRVAPGSSGLGASAAVTAAFTAEQPLPLEGTVTHGPESAAHGARLVVAVDHVAGQPARADVWLSVLTGWPDFGPGERVRFRARLREPRGLRNPELLDPLIAFRAAGIQALAAVPSASDIARLEQAPPLGVRRLAFRARRGLRAAIEASAQGETAAFLRTAVLGERRGVSDTVEAHFRAAGATHVLSVSGLHLAAVAGLLFLLVRAVAVRIPRLALRVDPRALAAAVALPSVAFFTLLTGEAVATERSALMIAVGLAAWLVGRSPSGPAAVAAAALALLLVGSPLLLFDVSLQLSFASVLGLVVLSGALGPRAQARGWRRRVGFWAWRFGAATVSATAATAPLVAHHFGEVAPAAPLGNFALVPLVELVVVPCGLLGAGLGALAPWLGYLPLKVAGLAARAALAVAAQFGAFAPVWLCRMPSPLETAALTAGLVLAVGAAGRGARRRRIRLAAALVLLGVASVSVAARAWSGRFGQELVVTFLDVGQGDAVVVQAPGGRTLIIDGGGTYDGAFDPGERVVEPFLRRRGITAVDIVALSHPHPDHLNGLLRIVDRFAVGALWTSGDDGKNPDYARLVSAAGARGVALDPPVATRLGALEIQPLGPWLDDRIAPPPGMSVNDASLVLRLAYGGRAVLFPGDLEGAGESELVGRGIVGQAINADVLKVPHHGSRTSSSGELLDAVHPTLAVASLGWLNRFHFPAGEVLDRYAARDIRLLRTDLHGAVTVTVSRAGTVSVQCQRGCE